MGTSSESDSGFTAGHLTGAVESSVGSVANQPSPVDSLGSGARCPNLERHRRRHEGRVGSPLRGGSYRSSRRYHPPGSCVGTLPGGLA